ncbi:MAG TPA: FliA/WhiG family RNA polymerase sigma factor [Acidimicrobiales bacterium]|nr:FliA/WhiG family RNA polymerase sigma factor [Acidimicrobiales bacterium]
MAMTAQLLRFDEHPTPRQAAAVVELERPQAEVVTPTAEREQTVEAENLWAELAAGERAARDRLVTLYYPLVEHVVRKMAATLSRRAELDDLRGFGAEGLIDAIDRFDPARGAQFSTFAAYRIKGAIYDGIRSSDTVPRSIRRREREIQTGQTTLAAELGRMPTEEEEADHLGTTVGSLRSSKALISHTQVGSLDGHPSMQDGNGIGDPAEAGNEPLAAYLSKEAVGAIWSGMRKLNERERTVLALSFFEGMALAEIGQILGVTESRACQIRASALARLRSYFTAQGLGPD